jgi:hypothetical protein
VPPIVSESPSVPKEFLDLGFPADFVIPASAFEAFRNSHTRLPAAFARASLYLREQGLAALSNEPAVWGAGVGRDEATGAATVTYLAEPDTTDKAREHLGPSVTFQGETIPINVVALPGNGRIRSAWSVQPLVAHLRRLAARIISTPTSWSRSHLTPGSVVSFKLG